MNRETAHERYDPVGGRTETLFSRETLTNLIYVFLSTQGSSSRHADEPLLGGKSQSGKK